MRDFNEALLRLQRNEQTTRDQPTCDLVPELWTASVDGYLPSRAWNHKTLGAVLKTGTLPLVHAHPDWGECPWFRGMWAVAYFCIRPSRLRGMSLVQGHVGGCSHVHESIQMWGDVPDSGACGR